MKESRDILSEVRSYFLVAWVISFPWWVKLSSVLVAISFVLYLIDSIRRKEFIYHFKQHLPVLIFVSIILISLCYSHDLDRGWGDVKKKLPLLLMPFSFMGVNLKYGMGIKRGLIASVLVYCLFNLVYCLLLYSQTTATSFVDYFQNFMIARWHPSYLTLYLLMGMVFAILDIMRGAKNNRFIIDSFTILILGTYICFFTARAAQICAGVLLLVVILYLLFKRLPKKLSTSLVSLIGVLLVVGFSTGKIQHQIHTLIAKEVKAGGVRIKVWPAALALIQEHVIVGVGAGDVRDNIGEKLKEQGDTQLANGQLNTHNEFLEVLLTLGIVGMISFLFLLFFPLFYLKNKLEYCLFLIICLVMFCFESTLNRQAGMIFFSFFYFLILWDDEGVQTRKLFDKKMSYYFLGYVLVNVSLGLTLLVGSNLSKYLLPSPSIYQIVLVYGAIFIFVLFSIKWLYKKLHRLLVVDYR